MSDRSQEIEKLKSIFERARHARRDERGYFKDLNLRGDVAGALTIAGKKDLWELKDEVYIYLKDPFPEFRAEAVRTLGWDTRLKLEEFRRDQAYKIWLQDSDEEVKVAALTAWSGYYLDTKNPEALRKLYEILISKAYTSEIRAHALKKIFDVANAWKDRREGYDVLELGDLEDPSEFENAVNWDRVNKVMQECVPGWKK